VQRRGPVGQALMMLGLLDPRQPVSVRRCGHVIEEGMLVSAPNPQPPHRHRLSLPMYARGLEGTVLNTLAAAADAAAQDVHEVVRRWFGQDVPDPWAAVIARVVRDAIEAGCLAAPAGHTLSSDAALRADLTAQSALVAARWRGFQASEPGPQRALLQQCRSAITSRSSSFDPYCCCWPNTALASCHDVAKALASFLSSHATKPDP
jgi:hypothetical protein